MEKSNKKVGGFDSFMGKIRRFCADTAAEMRRCSWPTKQQLLESTLLVVVAMVILACFVAGVDEVARLLIRLVTVRG
jgi:preprotein translocase SecE subunit